MPLDPFNPTRTNLRERWLKQQLDRLEARQIPKLLDAPRPGLSPLEAELNRQYKEIYKAATTRLRDALTSVKQQSAAERVEAENFKRQTPLQRAAKVGAMLHRSQRDINTAIAGIIQRERVKTAKLTRGSFDRAQAIAAARRKFEVAKGFKGSYDYNYAVLPWEMTDPCVEAKQTRRQVLFAKKLNKGWRSPHRYNPC